MKHLLTLSLGAILISMASCVKEVSNDNGDGGGKNPNDPNVTKELKGSYENDVTLQKGTYTLTGYVYFQNGATLKIPAGTIIKSSTTQKGALIIEMGAKIDAVGTASEPIVFTSGKPAGQRVRGDWGGIILLGRAPFNRSLSPRPLIEGGVDRRYGGDDPNDNSGKLQYVRIEYAGIAAEPNSEINALTLGAVGAGTTIDHIQTSFANDDAFEFFGGNVNAKYLVAYSSSDDDLDFDFGYSGKIQYAVIQRNPAIYDSDAGNGVEADNDGSGTTATPYTQPVLSNITWIGTNLAAVAPDLTNFGNRWRRAVRFGVHNSVMLGWPQGGFSMESAATVQAYKDGISLFRNNLVHALNSPYRVDAAGAAVMNLAEVTTKATADGNVVFPDAATIALNDPFNLNTPNYLPKAGSPALAGAVFTGLDAWFTNTTFRGAFGTENWMAGWTSFTPNTNAY